MPRRWATPGVSWRHWLRTEIAGERLLAAYAPEGVAAINGKKKEKRMLIRHKHDSGAHDLVNCRD